MRKTKNQCGGFSFVELLVALTIVVIAITGLLSTVNATSRMDAATRERSSATDAARQLLEETKSQFDTVDEYVAYFQGSNATVALERLQIPLAVRRQAIQDYLDDGSIATSAYDYLQAGTQIANVQDRSLIRLREGQATVNVSKTSNRLMRVSVNVSWTGAVGNSTLVLQTEVGK